MRSIALEDHDLPLADCSAFETDLQGRGARLAPPPQTYTTPSGEKRARLTAPVVEFDESQTDAAGLAQVLRAYGFREKVP
jgi:hypothetical protein